MSENLHDIDQLFRDAIEGQEEAPSGKVWDDIDHGLDKNNIVRTKRKYNNLKLFSAGLLLLLLGVIVYQFAGKKNAGSNAVVHRAAAENKTAPVPVNPSSGNSPAMNGQSLPGEATGLNPAHADALPGNSNPVNTTTGKKDESALVETVPASTAARPPAPAGAKTTAAEVAGTNTPKIPAAKEKANGIAAAAGNNPNTAATNSLPVKKSVIESTGTNAGVNAASNQSMVKSKKMIPVAGRLQHKAFAAAGEQDIANNKATLKKPSKPGNKNTGHPDMQHTLVADDAAALAVAGQQASHKEKLLVAPPAQQPRMLVGVPIDYTAATASLPIHVRMDDAMQPAIALENKAAPPVIAKKKAPLHFSVMPFYAPQFSSTRIETDQDHARPFPQGPNDRDKIKNGETYTSSSAVGILLELPLGKKWGLQSGISYNTRSVTIQAKNIYAQLDNDGKVKYRFDCSSGYTYLTPKTGTTPVVGDSIRVAASKNKLQYIGVPLTLNYTFFATKKINVVPAIGVMTNFLVKQSIETSLDPVTTNQKENITSIQGLKKTYFNGMAGIALQYNFNKRIALDIVPAANFALSSINQNATVKSYPNSFSITGGIKIQF